MKITYLGHSCLYFETNGKKLLVDPFIKLNPKATSIDIDTLEVDYVLLTHAHYDHMLDLEAIVNRTKAKIISNHEIVSYYTEKHQFEGHSMNQGGSWEFDFGKLKVVNAIHSSSFPDGTYGGNPVGFVLQAENKTVYIAGDTALTMDMKLIPLFFQLDLAILPIGGNFTMDVGEAIYASDFINCNRIMGVHYDTAEPIQINHNQARQDFKTKGKELLLLEVGEKLAV